MATTKTFTVDGDTITAQVTVMQDGDLAFYTISADDYAGGTILVQPARLGLHPVHGVMATFGGYDPAGFVDFSDWSVAGSVTCTGPDMIPGPTHGAKHYSIGDVQATDPLMADYIAAVVATIADDYAGTYHGRGHR